MPQQHLFTISHQRAHKHAGGLTAQKRALHVKLYKQRYYRSSTVRHIRRLRGKLGLNLVTVGVREIASEKEEIQGGISIDGVGGRAGIVSVQAFKQRGLKAKASIRHI